MEKLATGLLLAAAGAFTLSTSASADGINCNSLAEWSGDINGYRVNLHHVFCGEPGNHHKAKGFHSKPGGEAPTNYISSDPGSGPNAAGVYTARNIDLNFGGQTYTKSFSSLFPDSCTQSQVEQSIVYSHINSTGSCASPNWASCGPSGPAENNEAYCMGDDGNAFEIASALLPGTNDVNTGFPIYTP